MGIKCLILLLPFSLVTYRVQVRLGDFCTADLSLKICLFLSQFVFSLSYRTLCFQGRCLMLTEELGQVHQAMAPVSVWFRYLVSYEEVEGTTGLTLGILLALLYLIMKVALLRTRNDRRLHRSLNFFASFSSSWDSTVSGRLFWKPWGSSWRERSVLSSVM